MKHQFIVNTGCYQSRNYKIWKQFTTGLSNCPRCRSLLSITKLQNLKAIHNKPFKPYLKWQVVINHKTTKFESNSQLYGCGFALEIGCYQSQNYKIWKQFTTKQIAHLQTLMLLSITKLQNLKAIHNRYRQWGTREFVVINHKTTKFESNSQRTWELAYRGARCYQSQNYEIWKQFTT